MYYYLDNATYQKYLAYADKMNKNYSITGDKSAKKEYDDLMKILGKVRVINESDKSDNVVYVGDKVELLFGADDEPETYTLVIGYPANLNEVSISSPVGAELVQSEVGETKKYCVNGKNLYFTIKGKQSASETESERE